MGVMRGELPAAPAAIRMENSFNIDGFIDALAARVAAKVRAELAQDGAAEIGTMKA